MCVCKCGGYLRFHILHFSSVSTDVCGPSDSGLIFTSMNGIIYSTFTNRRYVVFIRPALVLKPHNLLTAEVCMSQPEINLAHNWGNK